MIVGVHERAWAVIDRLARHRHIIRVHHTVNESNEQPFCAELRLSRDNAVEHRAHFVWRGRSLRIMTHDDVVGEDLQRLNIFAHCEILKRSDADMACGHARQYCTGQRRFTPNRFPLWPPPRESASSEFRVPPSLR